MSSKARLLSTARVLLVDDDQIFRSEFKDSFEEYGIKEASSGDEALKILKKPNEIDLVILDVRMPGINGIEVLTKIKKMSPEVAIIISTAYSSKDVAIEALREKADDYIEKPLDIEATRKIIERMLEAKKSDVDYEGMDILGKIERVKNFLRRNCFKKVSLNDAAAAVYLSPKYLSRIFKAHTRTGFSDYKLALKINKAKGFLKKTGYNINQIADKLGYENTESFIKCFKKIAGLTPTEYRKKNK